MTFLIASLKTQQLKRQHKDVEQQQLQQQQQQQQQQQKEEMFTEISCCCLSVKNQAVLNLNPESLDEVTCCCCSFGCMQFEQHKESKVRDFYCYGKQCSFNTQCFVVVVARTGT